MYLMMLRFLRILSRYFARDRFYLAQLEENPQCKYCFRRRLSLSPSGGAVMNIHAGNYADNCGARADLKELHTRDYTYLSFSFSFHARAFFAYPRDGCPCARNSVVNSTTIGGLENMIAITPRHEGGRNE